MTLLVTPNPCGVVESTGGSGYMDCGWHGRRIAHGDVETGPFDEDDVDTIIAQWTSDDTWEGSVAGVLKLLDGRYVSWETFWGPTGDGFCEDAYGGDADIHYAATLDDIIRWGLTDEARTALGFVLQPA